MKILLKITLLMVCLIAWQPGLMAQDHSMMSSDSIRYTKLGAAELKWMDAPPGLPKGVKIAVLSGDPSKAGPFTIRLKFPQNFIVRPHWHSIVENITVIEGTLNMGTQEIFDKQKTEKLEKGGFSVMPANHIHSAFFNIPTVVQIHGIGPFSITYVNKNDDPRNKP